MSIRGLPTVERSSSSSSSKRQQIIKARQICLICAKSWRSQADPLAVERQLHLAPLRSRPAKIGAPRSICLSRLILLLAFGNMTTGVILCQEATTSSSSISSDSTTLRPTKVPNGFTESDWPRLDRAVKKFEGHEQPVKIKWTNLGDKTNEEVKSNYLVSNQSSSSDGPVVRANKSTALVLESDHLLANAVEPNKQQDKRRHDTAVGEHQVWQKSNKSSRSIRAHRLVAPSLLELDEESRNVAESEHHKQSECALILKRTYILNNNDQDDQDEAASSGQAQHGDEWGERFIFNDSDLEDKVSESRTRKNKKIHKTDLCIKHSDVDKAIEEAKHRIKFSRPADVDSAEVSERSIGSIGELNLATSLLLAQRFDLSHDEILNALPMIDMSSSLSLHSQQMDELCPKHVKWMACSKTRFRSITAHCNNLKHPSWGASKTPYSRYLPPDYADGLSAPRAARDGRPLPSARLISSTVHVDADEPSHDYSILFADWGQLLNHDVTRVAVGEAPDCCPQPLKGLCMPIPVPDDDPLYSQFNVKCLKFERALAAIRPKCLLGYRAQINLVTAPVDASFVYGSTKAHAQRLRAYSGGKMKVWNYFEKLKLKPLLPPKTEQPDQDCLARPKSLFCFDAGDVRVNEQTHLTVLHTIYIREHNRMAKQLSQLNMEWDDEKIYQETRHIVAAGVQHVLMNEFAPLLLGLNFVNEYKLRPNMQAAGDLHWNGYDPSVTISTGTAFAAAAFRYGHSMIEGLIRRLDPLSGHFIKGELLRFLFKRPFLLYEPGVIDQLIAGMLLTPSEQTDPFMSDELSGHLFQPPKAKFGHDLAAINIQRGRDKGVPGYNDWREWCGLSRAKSFSDLEPLLMNKTAWQYSKIYKHVDDIDLWSAGISERKLPGSAVGPTMACIIARQFLNFKRGDRYWYENPGQPSSFTPQQLREIKKTTLAKILCTNADDLTKVQPWAMRLPHPIYNAKVPCESLPSINLKHWDSSLVDNFDR